MTNIMIDLYFENKNIIMFMYYLMIYIINLIILLI